jgi:predicted RNase H-like nuclease (RuvC/YqgF family)
MTCGRLPSGFLLFFLLCVLALVFSFPANCQTVTVSEQTWNGLKVESKKLSELSISLQGNLTESGKLIDGLKENLMLLKYDLERARNESVILSGQLETAESQVTQLQESLTESQDSLSKATANVRKVKINNLLIGGAVGIAAGLIIGFAVGGN